MFIRIISQHLLHGINQNVKTFEHMSRALSFTLLGTATVDSPISIPADSVPSSECGMRTRG